MSVGYVAGFRRDTSNGGSVRHIIVNGAFNHGNSGGPLLVSRSSEVIGVVVLTYHFYPPGVRQAIDEMEKINYGLMAFERTKPDGTKEPLSEAVVTAEILDEFYQKTQVMIGEAISASELSAMIREHSSELPGRPPSQIPHPRPH